MKFSPFAIFLFTAAAEWDSNATTTARADLTSPRAAKAPRARRPARRSSALAQPPQPGAREPLPGRGYRCPSSGSGSPRPRAPEPSRGRAPGTQEHRCVAPTLPPRTPLEPRPAGARVAASRHCRPARRGPCRSSGKATRAGLSLCCGGGGARGLPSRHKKVIFLKITKLFCLMPKKYFGEDTGSKI